MKGLFLISGLISGFVLSFSAMARIDRSIHDLQYLPEEGVFSFESSFHYEAQSYNAKNTQTGSRISSSDHTDFYIKQRASYSFLQNLVVGGDIKYYLSDDHKLVTSNTNQTSNIDSSGIEEPRFFGRMRVSEDDIVPFIIDLEAGFSPGFSNGEKANALNKGNSLRGGMQFDLAAAFGQKWDEFSWRLGLGLVFDQERELDDATSGIEQYRIDSMMNTKISAALQYMGNQMLSFDFLLDYILHDEEKETNILSATSTTLDSYGEINATARMNVSFNPSLLLSVYGSYLSLDDTDSTTSSGGALTKRTSWDGFAFGAQLRYEF